MTAIIILNWNGASDTIGCIESLLKVRDHYFCIIVDNGSTDDSVIRISNYMQGLNIPLRIRERQDTLTEQPKDHEFILLKNNQNMGFAKGNNEAIRFIANTKPDYYLLLNNDTVVEEHFLHELESFSKDNSSYKILTPLIFYYFDKDKIWNAGGIINLGIRKYFYAGKTKDAIKETGHIDVSFITGCAMFFKPEILRADGGIFTEDFFFGEEDFNLCLNMKKSKTPMACVLKSVIHHKVNAATKNVQIGKYYIHYLNRFIDIRRSMGWPFYLLWAIPNSIHATLLLIKKHYGINKSIRTILDVNRDAMKKNGVTQQDFIKAINER